LGGGFVVAALPALPWAVLAPAEPVGLLEEPDADAPPPPCKPMGFTFPSSVLLGKVALGPLVSEPGSAAVESSFSGALAPFMSSALALPAGLLPPFAAVVPDVSSESW
jgi:hypothetical protein